MSISLPIAEWLERHAGKQGVAGSIPGGCIHYHFEIFANGTLFTSRCKIKFWPPIEYRPGVNIQWIFRWIMTLLSCWILITLLNFDTFLSRNSTGRTYVDGSEFHVELWPRVKIPRWIMTLGQNSTLDCDPNTRWQLNVESWLGVTIQRWIETWGLTSTWNQDPGSQFNMELWAGVTFQRGILTRVTIQRGILTRGHISTWNADPGSQFNVELWPRVKIPRWIVIPIPGHNLTLNHDSGSKFNVGLIPRVIIQRGIKTRGHNSTGGPNFIRRRGRNSMTPCLWGRNSTWKIRWILSTARWIKTPRVEIQWGQNSILHRRKPYKWNQAWHSSRVMGAQRKI